MWDSPSVDASADAFIGCYSCTKLIIKLTSNKLKIVTLNKHSDKAIPQHIHFSNEVLFHVTFTLASTSSIFTP